jgi:Zn-dependent membrane protease YugP
MALEGGRTMYFYLLLAIPPLVAGLLAQAWVRRTFTEASKIQAVSGLTGAQVSRRMLDEGGLTNVSVEGISGELSDHYDPRTKTMRLSQPVGGSDSVAAVAVAAHETGHAFQDAHHEAGFRFRGALVPATGFASQAWFPIFLIGLFMGVTNLALLGVALFAAIVLFQRTGERVNLIRRAHAHGDEAGQEIGGHCKARALRNIVHLADDFDAMAGLAGEAVQ